MKLKKDGKLPNLRLTRSEKSELKQLSRSRLAPAGEVERARILIAYDEGVSISEIGRIMHVDRSKIYRCINKAIQFGIYDSLPDLQRPGRQRVITPEAKAWVVSIACQKPVDLGYPHEVWTQELLASHTRKHCLPAGHPSLSKANKATVNRILSEDGIKPHKISYYLEKRDPDFEVKMNDVLCIYQEVDLIKRKGQTKDEPPIAVVSYDEKPGIQAIANVGPDLAPIPGKYSTIARDHEYKRLGTVSLLAGIDLITGIVHHVVADRHRSREFIQFLKQIDKAYPELTKIRVILDNHSAHISKETQNYLQTVPDRFEFTFTPKHGSWLNLIEVFFSKMSRTVLRHIRVHSKSELVSRMKQYLNELNENPVVFNWKYGINGSLRSKK